MFNILFNPKKAERHVFEMMLIGFFYASLSLLLGLWIFPEHVSLVMVFLTVLSCLYIVQGAIKVEEGKEQDFKPEGWVLKEHYSVVLLLLFLFFGFILAFTFWSFVLPAGKVVSVFSLQSSVVDGIREMVTTGNAFNKGAFSIILVNNLKVLLISLIFAFFYGAGAIFILAWNASVMGFVIGTLARETFGLTALPVAFVKYFLHGIPEMLAYLTAALAGGIIYVAVWTGDLFKQGRAKRIIIDTLILVVISVLLLIIAALIEIYISPFI